MAIKKITKPKLTATQLEQLGMMNDISFESNLPFDEAIQKALGTGIFPRTRQGKLFRAEAKKIFDQERQK
jgi:hypothetical protein